MPLTKKRYAAWKFEAKGPGEWKETIETKGIETVRRDWCGLVGETMNEVLKIILTEQDVKKASAFARQIIKDLQAGKIPVEKEGENLFFDRRNVEDWITQHR